MQKLFGYRAKNLLKRDNGVQLEVDFKFVLCLPSPMVAQAGQVQLHPHFNHTTSESFKLMLHRQLVTCNMVDCVLECFKGAPYSVFACSWNPFGSRALHCSSRRILPRFSIALCGFITVFVHLLLCLLLSLTLILATCNNIPLRLRIYARDKVIVTISCRRQVTAVLRQGHSDNVSR